MQALLFEAGSMGRRFGKTEALKQAVRDAVARDPDAVIAWASPQAGPDRPWHAPDGKKGGRPPKKRETR